MLDNMSSIILTQIHRIFVNFLLFQIILSKILYNIDIIISLQIQC